MIVSFWPTQPCIAVMPDSRCALPQHVSKLEMLGKEQEARPLIKKMFLIALRLSGNPLKCRGFLRGLGTSSYNFGDVELSNSTYLTLQRELHFVVAYKLIVFHPLHPKIKNGTGYVV